MAGKSLAASEPAPHGFRKPVPGQRLMGVLDLQSKAVVDFQPEELSALQTLANQVAIAIENAFLVRQNREALDAVQRAYAELSGQAWEKSLRAQPNLGFRCNVDGAIQPVSGPWPEDMAQASTSGQAFQAQTAGLALPIRIRGQVAGAISLLKPKDSGEWLPEEIELAETINDRLAAALESARLYEETRRRAERERLTGQITAACARPTTPTPFFKRLPRSCARLCKPARRVFRLKGWPLDR